jgi:hypothetical protein
MSPYTNLTFFSLEKFREKKTPYIPPNGSIYEPMSLGMRGVMKLAMLDFSPR